VLGVSPSGYYAWITRKPSRRSLADARLLPEIRRVHEINRQAYGTVKTWKALNEDGIRCGKHRIARLRSLHGIQTLRRKRFKVTTDSRHAKWIAPNRLGRRFKANRPNEVWVGDVTFVATRSGWLHVAVLLDLCSRKVVGWSMSERIDKQLVINALKMALLRRNPTSGLLHHTDRGSVYASDDYQRELSSRGLVPSMSRKGDCFDNAVAESFFSTLKNELLLGGTYQTRDHARTKIFEYIEVFYNRQRLHQSLNYLTPEQAEMMTVTK